MPNRRKLSSRDLLLIELGKTTHSLNELAHIFKISRRYVIYLTKKGIRCPICKAWKPKDQGRVMQDEKDSTKFFWVCDDCLNIETA